MEGDPQFAQGDLFDESVRRDGLADEVRRVVEGIERQRPRTRAEAGERVVVPLLEALGWGGDRGRVVADFETASGRVDFALCPSSSVPALLIAIDGAFESDRKGEAGRVDRLFADSSVKAVQVVVSAERWDWRLHYPAPRAPLARREFARVELYGDPSDAAKTLDRFVSQASSGGALRRAEREYAALRFPAEALGAWRRALEGDRFLKLFEEALLDAIGAPADSKRAAAFASGQRKSVEWLPDPPDPGPARRVRVGDRVWVYHVGRREIERHDIVASDPDFERGQVSADSPWGGMIGASEGDVREIRLPKGSPREVRVLLIRRQDGAAPGPRAEEG